MLPASAGYLATILLGSSSRKADDVTPRSLDLHAVGTDGGYNCGCMYVPTQVMKRQVAGMLPVSPQGKGMLTVPSKSGDAVNQEFDPEQALFLAELAAVSQCQVLLCCLS